MKKKIAFFDLRSEDQLTNDQTDHFDAQNSSKMTTSVTRPVYVSLECFTRSTPFMLAQSVSLGLPCLCQPRLFPLVYPILLAQTVSLGLPHLCQPRLFNRQEQPSLCFVSAFKVIRSVFNRSHLFYGLSRFGFKAV